MERTQPRRQGGSMTLSVLWQEVSFIFQYFRCLDFKNIKIINHFSFSPTVKNLGILFSLGMYSTILKDFWLRDCSQRYVGNHFVSSIRHKPNTNHAHCSLGSLSSGFLFYFEVISEIGLLLALLSTPCTGDWPYIVLKIEPMSTAYKAKHPLHSGLLLGI